MNLRALLVSLFFYTLSQNIISQDCSSIANNFFGHATGDERGLSLAPSLQNDGFFVAGKKDDSIRVMRFDLSGQVLWSRTFDIIPGKNENVNSMLIDSDGMLGISGTGGSMPIGSSVFAFRYDPVNNTVLWAKEYVHTSRTNNFTIIQLGAGGNYLIANNPYYSGTDDSELLELDLNSGDVVPDFSINYDLGASEIISELVYSGSFLYGTGRYTDGSSPAEMRNAVMKLNADDGSQVWVKLGHKTANASARLYPVDLVVDGGFIYSVYQGDPDGTSTSVTDFFVQKTSLDGELVWLNQYDLPGVNDDVYELVNSGDGYVILAGNRAVPTELELFKIDPDGEVMWAKQFDFPSFIENIGVLDSKSSQLIEVGDKLIFTGFASNTSGGNNMFLVMTDLEGELTNSCIRNQSITIPVIPVDNPSFYSVSPDAYSVSIQVNTLTSTGISSGVTLVEECVAGTIETNIDTTICEGEAYQGYSQSGVYVDTFLLGSGCDSIRTLQLTINACQSECEVIIGSIYGAPSSNETGISIAFSPQDNSVYVTGTKEDSTFIIKMNTDGSVVWSKTIDVYPDGDEFPTGILVDSEGMLAIVGTTGEYFVGGDIYVIRYDPVSQTLLWANTYDHAPRDFSFGLIQKGNENYVITNQATFSGHHEPDVIELDLITGAVIPGFAKNYEMSGTESLYDLTYDGNFLYGVGRYKDGGTVADMRNALVKLDPDDGNQIWVRLGHINPSLDARLYGTDLIVEPDGIYSIYFGDPDGSSITSTLLYIQKTDFDGNLIWLNQYDLPGENDISLDIIRSGDGFVVLGHKRAEGEYVLFKVDSIGNVLWGNSYSFNSLVNINSEERSSAQLVEAGNQLIFTGFGTADGNTDIIIARTDLEGNSQVPCMEALSITIPFQAISNPTFYPSTPEQTSVEVNLTAISSAFNNSNISAIEECVSPDTIYTSVEASICEGEVYEGYSVSGIYVDNFLSVNGCDSIRTLTLTVNVCSPGCGEVIGSIYGADESDEEGKSIAVTAEGDGYYIAGAKNDSVLIAKILNDGSVVWSRTFEIVEGEVHDINSILLDSDGQLVLVGTTGGTIPGHTIFIFRYDPNLHQILWANEIITADGNESYVVLQKPAGGNYIISNNPSHISISQNDSELLEINKSTGDVVPVLSIDYRFGSSEHLTDLVWHDNFLYGVGRYTDGPSPAQMRHTLAKINPANGDQVWVKMGHVPRNLTARLYGSDLVITNNEIYSLYQGDPDGTSFTNTNLYIQKTDLDGNLIWLKQYELPGPSDYGYELISSGNGFVVLAIKAAFPGEIILFKIDANGDVLWGNLMQPGSLITSMTLERATYQLVESGNQLAFIATGTNTNGNTDMLFVITDLEGQVSNECMNSLSLPITAQDVNNPVFYTINPDQLDITPVLNPKTSHPVNADLQPRLECIIADTITTTIEATICSGGSFEGYFETGIYSDTFSLNDGCDSIRILDLTVTPPVTTVVNKNICHNEEFEGYTISGIYADTFALVNGCDSVRILRLDVFACAPIIHYDLNACRAIVEDNTNMDYSEFVPTFPEFSCADINAQFLYRFPPQDNKHSCTPGVNNTVAMCVSSYNSCTYSAGNSASIIIEFSVNPQADSLFRFSGLQFYEKAPATYTWIAGPSGPNNYPLKYGIRILKNGVEIFRDEDIQTNLNWTLQTFDFIDNELFRVEAAAGFRIELLPYCPVGNGAEVSAWDIDEIQIIGACAPIEEDKSSVSGNVITANGKAISDVEIKLSENISFIPEIISLSDQFGAYAFDELQSGKGYFIKGYNNNDPLNGVSTLDLILIQKHLLGTIPFNTLNNYVAADANHSGNVSVVDLLEIRKLLLGKYSSFPKNTSWRFGVWPQDMNGSNISSFREIQTIEYLGSGTLNSDFLGIKIGDINGDVHPNDLLDGIVTRSSKEFSVSVEETKTEPGKSFIIEIKSEQVEEIAGIQFAMDLKGMNLVSVLKGKMPVQPENYTISNDGRFRFSWHTDESLQVNTNDVLFSIELTPSQSGLLSENLRLIDDHLSPEVYSSDLDIFKLKMSYAEKITPSQAIDFFSVEPNPFHSEFNLRLNLTQAGNVEINFYDVSGRPLHHINKMYLAGEHTEKVSANLLSVNEGVIYCQIISNGLTTTQKIVKLQ